VIVFVFNVDGHEYFSEYNRPQQNGPATTVSMRQAGACAIEIVDELTIVLFLSYDRT
jgi:hypothetical protein